MWIIVVIAVAVIVAIFIMAKPKHSGTSGSQGGGFVGGPDGESKPQTPRTDETVDPGENS